MNNTFSTTGATFASFVKTIMGVIYTLEWLLSGLALAVFVWGVVRFIGNAGSTKGQQEGYTFIVWGTIALFVIFSISGILYLACNAFFTNATGCRFF